MTFLLENNKRVYPFIRETEVSYLDNIFCASKQAQLWPHGKKPLLHISMYLESPGKVVSRNRITNFWIVPVVYFLIIWVKTRYISKKSIMTSFKQKTFDNDSYLVEEEKDLPLSSVPLEVWNDKKGM